MQRVTNIQGKKKSREGLTWAAESRSKRNFIPVRFVPHADRLAAGTEGIRAERRFSSHRRRPFFLVLFMTLWSYAKEINRFKKKKNRFVGETVLRARFHPKRRSNRHPPIKNIRLRRRRHSTKSFFLREEGRRRGRKQQRHARRDTGLCFWRSVPIMALTQIDCGRTK